LILVAAATRWESKPLRSALEGPGVRLFETGVGPERAAAAFRSLNGERPAAVLTAGFAGALQPDLRRGDLVLDLRDAPPGWASSAERAAAACGARLRLGAVLSSERVVAGPEDKLRLGASEGRPLAVDMESETARAWARARGVPFAAARVILDDAEDRMLEDAPEGSLAAYALRHWRSLPLLLGLSLRQGPAMRRLGRFLRSWLSEVSDDRPA